jgi:hypothetical protein
MAQPELERFKRRGVTLAVETVEGVDQAPTAVANGIQMFDGRSGTEFDRRDRPLDRAFFTNDPFVVGNRRSFIEGGVELYSPSAPGAAGATGQSDIHALLTIAGLTLVRSLTAGVIARSRYNPVSAAIASATAYWYHVDILRKVLGARANLSGVKQEIGERFMAQARILGTYTDVTQVAIPTITYPTTVPPVSTHLNSEAYIDLDAEGAGAELLVWAKRLSLDFGSELTSKEYTSVMRNQINDRRATWSMLIARTALADFNPWAVRDAATIISARYVLEETAGGMASELGIRGQIETIEEADIDGDLGWELSGPCIASSAGGDEFYISFDDTSPP